MQVVAAGRQQAYLKRLNVNGTVTRQRSSKRPNGSRNHRRHNGEQKGAVLVCVMNARRPTGSNNKKAVTASQQRRGRRLGERYAPNVVAAMASVLCRRLKGTQNHLQNTKPPPSLKREVYGLVLLKAIRIEGNARKNEK